MNRLFQWGIVTSLALIDPVGNYSTTRSRPLAEFQAPKPTLVVFLTIDQMRGDYLARFGSQFTGGLRRLDANGAHFTHAYQDHGITETAPGHASTMSGRYPVHTGIAANDEGVGDAKSPLVIGSETGASPYRFRGTTLLDWMRANDRQTRFLSVSRKDRSAILPVGKSKGDVYWYSADGVFTTSQYYTSALPAWVNEFNARALPAGYAGWNWTPLLADSAYTEPDSVPLESSGRNFMFPHPVSSDPTMAVQALANYPVMDELLLKFALAGVRQLQLGANSSRTDLLNISLSTTDAVGHRYGPDSKELHDQLLRVDRYLGVFFDSLFAMRDSTRVIIALTGDHGVSPFPGAVSQVTPNPGAKYVDIRPVWRATIARLAAAGVDTMQVDFSDGAFMVGDTSSFVKAKVSVDSVSHALINDLRAVPGVSRADMLRDLAKSDTANDAVARRWLHTFAPGGLVRLVTTFNQYDYWAGTRQATHGSPWDQDAWVPVVFWGTPFARGKYDTMTRVVDMAPTLAEALHIKPLEKLDGVVLRSALH